MSINSHFICIMKIGLQVSNNLGSIKISNYYLEYTSNMQLYGKILKLQLNSI